jgi:hypothetical protein
MLGSHSTGHLDNSTLGRGVQETGVSTENCSCVKNIQLSGQQ